MRRAQLECSECGLTTTHELPPDGPPRCLWCYGPVRCLVVCRKCRPKAQTLGARLKDFAGPGLCFSVCVFCKKESGPYLYSAPKGRLVPLVRRDLY